MTEQSILDRWYYNPWMVVAILFLALGPFGLPLLYKSPKFSRTWKIVLTIVMIPYTWWMVVLSREVLEKAQTIAAQLQQATP